ncbi:MAG TPA: methyl-accepting chemotaxis protein [Smithella sp.]|nr:methyl-accepting chemotaxis protein [Smithella sp.]MDM7986043.1 methyl-accepting chemotaxis protein [Smithella sp.]HNY50766.1 methyl-accepting chemotaxis protein [Smithella sp.]HOG90305.1 methyl-accepting chemotaxis protein [Smithella sp.]HOU51799.1 methyl-accepting chemotaxis protein [Smithella sp.]
MKLPKRRNYFIEKKFQAKYILLTILLLLFYTFIFVVLIFSPYIYTLYFDYPLAEKAEASRAMLLLHSTIWPKLGLIIVVFSIASIFITHKVAGPVYRLKRSIAQVTQGDLSVVIKLRKGDDLKELAEHINLLIENMRNFVTTLKVDYNMLSEQIQDLEQKIEKKDLPEETGRAIINKIKASRKNIEDALEKFNIRQ